MAGTLTHNKMAHELYKELKSLDLAKDYFIVGNQGHDLIDFIRLYEFPFKNIIFKSVPELQLVDINVLKKYCQNLSKNAKSFMYGYIAHELLDRKVHPFIDLIADYDHQKHALYESIVDVKINDMQNIAQILPKKVALTPDFQKEISMVFQNCFQQSKYSKRILKNINNVTRFLKLYRFDKTGIKRFFYRLLGLKYLSFHYSSKELNIDLTEFLKLYQEAKKEIILFLKNM